MTGVVLSAGAEGGLRAKMRLRNPAGPHFDIGPFYRRPSNAMHCLFLARVSGMVRVSSVERYAINILRVIGENVAQRERQV
jgi:hypothetical protein